MSAAVEVEQLVREFKGGIRAVDGLDLEVRDGEIYGFLGPNGAGKTTVVRILTTLLRPTAGRARVAGHDVVGDGDAVRRAIGVALQEAAIDPLMTGRELLHMQGALHEDGTTVFLTTQYLEEAEQLADRVGIIHRGNLVAEGTPTSLKARVGEPTVHVEMTDPEDAARACRALAGLGTVERPTERAPTRIGVRTAAGSAAIAPVVRALDEAGVEVEFVEVESPTLDDVFMAVTGSHLEGAAAA